MENKFEVGNVVECKKFASLKHDFQGVIEKIYENSAMVMITGFDPEDETTVSDFHDYAIVSLKEMKLARL